MTDVATQTDNLPMTPTEKTNIKATQIKEVKTLADFARVKNYTWPEEVYLATKHEIGPMVKIGKEYDLLVWDEGEASGSQTNKVLDKYNELKELEGDTTYLYLTTKQVDASGRKIERNQIVTKMKTDGSEADCFHKLCHLKDNMKREGRKLVAMYPPSDDDRGEVFRKMVECTFAGSDIQCCVCYTNKRRERQSRERETDALIVCKEEGRTFAPTF